VHGVFAAKSSAADGSTVPGGPVIAHATLRRWRAGVGIPLAVQVHGVFVPPLHAIRPSGRRGEYRADSEVRQHPEQHEPATVKTRNGKTSSVE
jgi:hypothetical protein